MGEENLQASETNFCLINPLITVVAFWRHTALLPLSPFGVTTATQTKRLIPWLPSFVDF